MSLRVGEVVMGRYRIARCLAAGGMGVVYLARIEGAEGFTRPAVVKRMLPTLSEDDELVQMFVREARILSELHHPNIVDVLDFASEGDSHLMALEYVHGYSVGHWAKYLRRQQEPFPLVLACWIVVQVLDALHYAHTRTDATGRSLGIVHRDISPSNVLLDVEGHVRLVDFGVARPLGEATRPKDGEVAIRGKFPYMAPELLSGAPPTGQTDTYACGILLHELLLGRNEMRDPDLSATIRRVMMHELTRVSQERPDATPELDEVLRRATAKDPEARYRDAAEMAEGLRALLPSREDHLRAELRARAREDFLGGMPESLDLDPLDELERSWKTTIASDVASSGPRVSDAPTQLARTSTTVASADVTETIRPRRSMLFVSLIAAGAAIAAAVAVTAAFWPSKHGPDRVVIVQQRLDTPPTDDGTRSTASADPNEATGSHDETSTHEETANTHGAMADTRDGTPVGTLPIDPVERDPIRRPRRPTSPAEQAAALTRLFNTRQARLRACFEAHAQRLEGRPQLSIRFRVDRTGAVREAELAPADLATTPLGRCMLGVARSTEFGAQPDELVFRIPIAVHSQ